MRTAISKHLPTAMATKTQPYRIRPGRASDVGLITDLYKASFAKDTLVDFLFPKRADHPEQFHTFIYRLFQNRYWTLGFDLSMLEDAEGRPIGFSWWRRPMSQLSFYERWLSPYAWFAPLMRAYVSLKNTFSPQAGMDPVAATAYHRILAKCEPRVLTTPARVNGWYLSTLAVHPSAQGLGLGGLLLRHGLEKVDRRGAVCWLVGVGGVEKYYSRFGFVEVDRMNVDDLERWDGGSMMFRE